VYKRQAINGLLSHVLFVAGLQAEDVGPNCVGIPPTFGRDSLVDGRLAGGIQIFPGSVPIYRGDTLVGGIGISGDGVDQDDMIAFLGVHNAGENLAGALGNAPPDIRADRLTPRGTRLRYVQCPQAPFLGSDDTNVCSGK